MKTYFILAGLLVLCAFNAAADWHLDNLAHPMTNNEKLAYLYGGNQ